MSSMWITLAPQTPDTEVVELSDEAISRIADELEKRLGNSLGKGGSDKDDDNPFIEGKVEIASESELTDAEKEALGSDDNVLKRKILRSSRKMVLPMTRRTLLKPMLATRMTKTRTKVNPKRLMLRMKLSRS